METPRKKRKEPVFTCFCMCFNKKAGSFLTLVIPYRYIGGVSNEILDVLKVSLFLIGTLGTYYSRRCRPINYVSIPYRYIGDDGKSFYLLEN